MIICWYELLLINKLYNNDRLLWLPITPRAVQQLRTQAPRTNLSKPRIELSSSQGTLHDTRSRRDISIENNVVGDRVTIKGFDAREWSYSAYWAGSGKAW